MTKVKNTPATNNRQKTVSEKKGATPAAQRKVNSIVGVKILKETLPVMPGLEIYYAVDLYTGQYVATEIQSSPDQVCTEIIKVAFSGADITALYRTNILQINRPILNSDFINAIFYRNETEYTIEKDGDFCHISVINDTDLLSLVGIRENQTLSVVTSFSPSCTVDMVDITFDMIEYKQLGETDTEYQTYCHPRVTSIMLNGAELVDMAGIVDESLYNFLVYRALFIGASYTTLFSQETKAFADKLNYADWQKYNAKNN